jgi:DNA ligase D-like protein (predicted ligase)
MTGPAVEFVAPMLATLSSEYFSDDRWIYERKLDGVRAVVVHGPNDVRLYSRNRKPLGDTYPELREALAARTSPGTVLDGEIVAFRGSQTSFERLQGRMGITDPVRARATGIEVFIYLFDMMARDGDDLTPLPLRERKRLLRESVEFADPIRFSEHRDGDGERFLREACEKGWEGLIAKEAGAVYRPGRRTDKWLKFKCVHQQELVIGGFTDPAGSRVGFGALLVGYFDGDRLRHAGKVGTGFDERTLRSLRREFDRLGSERSPFGEPVRMRGAHWVRPELVAEIGFTEWTRDGRLRHPRYLGLRDDKPADQVVREEGAR